MAQFDDARETFMEQGVEYLIDAQSTSDGQLWLYAGSHEYVFIMFELVSLPLHVMTPLTVSQRHNSQAPRRRRHLALRHTPCGRPHIHGALHHKRRIRR